MKWIDTSIQQPDQSGNLIEVEIEHYNKNLGLENKVVLGKFGSDCFYLSDGGELSYSWNIIKWRPVDTKRNHKYTNIQPTKDTK